MWASWREAKEGECLAIRKHGLQGTTAKIGVILWGKTKNLRSEKIMIFLAKGKEKSVQYAIN